ncbi:MAG: glycosyltransferase family 4 protein [Oceanicaulis sp.]|nr:glycosyltransferase family 4 protein [Oceanicaulis sp.]
MVILQLIPELEAGGAERTTIEIAEAVTRAGGRCLVASRGGRLEDALAEAGGELVRLDMKSKNPVTLWRNAARLTRLIRSEDVNIVHARSRAPAWSGRWAAGRTGAHFVTTYHGTYSAKSGLKRAYNAVMAGGERVIANSHFIADHVRTHHRVGEARLRVIPRGGDLDVFDPQAVRAKRIARMREGWGAAAEDAVILLPGRLTRWKGQAFMIDVMAGWDCARRRVHLVCLGDAQGRSGYAAELEAQAQAANVTLVLPGHESDMAAAYLAADVVVCPSLQPEAFGRTAAEAQAMGAPVIAADHGGAREVVADRETGWRAAPGDTDSWRTAMTAAVSLSPKERAELSARARARAAQLFSKQALQESTLQVYRELLE